MSNTKRAGRRERLLARKRPSFVYHLAVEDDTDAVAELAAAKDALDVAQLRDDDVAKQAIADAEKRLAAARTAVEACYEPVTFTALKPAAFEELAAKPEHAPREGKEEKWNADTFPRSCFMACVDTTDLTVDEWAEFVDANLSQAERLSLFLTAVSINARWPDGAIPKD